MMRKVHQEPERVELVPLEITRICAGQRPDELHAADRLVIGLKCLSVPLPPMGIELASAGEVDDIIEALTRAREWVWGPRS